MTVETTAVEQIESFLESWQGDNQPMRGWFQRYFQKLMEIDDTDVQFVARPGVSYSIRPVHRSQTSRDKFAMVDVIDDDPAERWLSVCFYQDMITDPEERGELIPGGLAGDDGYCFDLFDDDEKLGHYILERLLEAGRTASR